VAKPSRELYALGRVFRVKCVGVFHKQVRVEQFFAVLIRISRGRLGAAKVDRLVIASHDGIDGRVLSRSETFKSKLVLVISERGGNVRGEEQRGNLADHMPTLLHSRPTPGSAAVRSPPAAPSE